MYPTSVVYQSGSHFQGRHLVICHWNSVPREGVNRVATKTNGEWQVTSRDAMILCSYLPFSAISFVKPTIIIYIHNVSNRKNLVPHSTQTGAVPLSFQQLRFVSPGSIRFLQLVTRTVAGFIFHGIIYHWKSL